MSHQATNIKRFLFLAALFFIGTQAAYAQDAFVVMDTTKGRIVIRVFRTLAPYTSRAWLSMVDEGFYNGLTFHRVESWVVQGGCPDGTGTGNYVDQSTGQPRFLRLETSRALTHNQAGMVAMARTNNPNSASCQFYILRKPMPQLNGKYSVFGKVVQGMQSAMALRIGDRILSARIADSSSSGSGGTTSSGWGSSGSSSGTSSEQAVPYVDDPAARPSGPPHGDSGF